MKIVSLRMQISLPFDHFNNLGSVHGRIGKNTAWELEHTQYSGSLFDIDFSWSIREDHAGLEIGIGLFGYGVGFRIYDTRHWDNETNSWKKYEDQI